MWLALLVAASENPSPAQLDPDHTVEYAQYFDDGWRWFYIPTNNSNAVTASLVTQRGEQNNFPKMGFVLLSSQSSETVPSFSNPDNYDPDGYEHDFPIGPRLQYNRDTTFPSTDWRALTVGYDTSASASDPESTQVPLENVLIGIRCYETDWTAPLAGCRYSLTAQLLPFTLQPGDRIVSPMGRIYRAENANGGTVASPATHIYRVEVGGYDTLGFDIERDGSNHSAETNAGLVGVALLQRNGWSKPAPLYDGLTNLSGSCSLTGTACGANLGELQDETAAMLDYEGRILRKGWLPPVGSAWEARSVAGKGALRPSLCKTGDAGCRARVDPSTLSDAKDAGNREAAIQDELRSFMWAETISPGQGFAAIHTGAPSALLQRLCVSAEEAGNYYLALTADMDESGDGRLSAGDGWLAAVRPPARFAAHPIAP